MRSPALTRRAARLLGGLLIAVTTAWLPAAAQAPPLPTPTQVLGYAPGSPGRLADVDEVFRYFELVAERSRRVRWQRLGNTWEGRTLSYALISAPENLARAEDFRRKQQLLADPRGQHPARIADALRTGKVIVQINASLHGNEVGPTQASMNLVHRLATTEDPELLRVLREVILILVPCQNPDGYARFVDWAARPDLPVDVPLPGIYHRYCGHDINRDWMLLTQRETEATASGLVMRWLPHVTIDQHQMGPGGPRLWLPPYAEPRHPAVPRSLAGFEEKLGRGVLARLTKQGERGVICNTHFDAWSPSRAFMHYHAGARFLTEVASCRVCESVRVKNPLGANATPSRDHPAPWKGGEWGLSDVLRLCEESSLGALIEVARDPRPWRKNFATICREACEGREGPGGYLLPGDDPRRSARAALIRALRLGGVEIEELRAGDVVDGRVVPKGTLLIRNGQPWFAFARALLSNPAYPRTDRHGRRLRTPYDATCQSMPLLMGVRCRELARGVGLPSRRPLHAAAGPAATEAAPSDFLLDPRDEGALGVAHQLLARGASVGRLVQPCPPLPAGALVVTDAPRGFRIPAHLGIWAAALAEGRARIPLGRSNVAVYRSWTASDSEGWMRFSLEKLGVRFRELRDNALRTAGVPDEIDVLIVSDLPVEALERGLTDPRLPARFRGGLGPEGVNALRRFVHRGGRLILMNRACRAARPWFGCTLRLKSLPRGRLSGSALAAWKVADSPLTWGLSPTLVVPWHGGVAFEDTRRGAHHFPVRYPGPRNRARMVLGGVSEGLEALLGAAPIAHCRHGRGDVVLFGFDVTARTWPRAAWPVLMNAVLNLGEDST